MTQMLGAVSYRTELKQINWAVEKQTKKAPDNMYVILISRWTSRYGINRSQQICHSQEKNLDPTIKLRCRLNYIVLGQMDPFFLFTNTIGQYGKNYSIV